ncbi:hypothetical protein OGAPHI_007144 [Ogataea philodendri]|uniref:RAVE complex protein Rav1 C-terminal domain-containing protein n=1 Tax=Ogataea philodendri TaxID=1378263 RepID=A0A9P8SZB5_9ASCO|nr:uncharacterized protein OGAPHI_007144 [Ogataea philodendri]KAH3660558.1 hypothetical protein OGAPHI_007144 [Ogataea philodendri]
MSLNFVPGEPNRTPHSSAFVNWNDVQILAYCSGNSLVIVTKNFQHLQTLYLSRDSYVVDINRVNGKIAVGVGSSVQIYTPTVSNFYNYNFRGRKDVAELEIEWSLESEITNNCDNSPVTCIAWSDLCDTYEDEVSTAQLFGLPEEYNSLTSCELCVGSEQSLALWRLYYTAQTGKHTPKHRLLWHKKQPNPVYMARFSPNSSTIATTGYGDRLVKVWHRVAFGIESAEFELNYVAVAAHVSLLHWKAGTLTKDDHSAAVSVADLKPANSIIKDVSRRPLERTSADNCTLYVYGDDSALRVFSMYYRDTGFTVVCSGLVQLPVDSFVAVVDSQTVDLGIRNVLDKLELHESHPRIAAPARDTEVPRSRSGSTLSLYHRRQSHLAQLLATSPEICLVFDRQGRAEIYTLVGSDGKINVGKLDGVVNSHGGLTRASIQLGKNCIPSDCQAVFVQDVQLTKTPDDMSLSLIIHDLFKNSIRHVGVSFSSLFQFEELEIASSISTKVTIGELQHKFTGLNKSIRKLIRSADGSVVLSTTRFGENCLWTALPLSDSHKTLNKNSTLITQSPILDAAFWKQGTYVIAYLEDSLVCFDCRLQSQYQAQIAKLAPVTGKFPVSTKQQPSCFFMVPETETDTAHAVAVYPDGTCSGWELVLNNDKCEIKQYPVQQLPSTYLASYVNPAGWKALIDENTQRDVLSTIDLNGDVRIYSTRLENGEISWILKREFSTGICKARFLNGSSIHRLAIVSENSDQLYIWDTRLGTLEYSETFETEQIKDIDWTCTNFNQGILAVGFDSHSLLYTQLRYDYTNNTPTYAKIKNVDISHQTRHKIGDSIWLSDGLLVIGSGNQFYISDQTLDPKKDYVTARAMGTLEIASNDIFQLCAALNGPLPLYHPQFIIQALLLGDFSIIKKIICGVSKSLRDLEFGTAVSVDPKLGINTSELQQLAAFDEEETTISKQMCDTIVERLAKHKLPFLTGHQQITLSSTVQIVSDIAETYGSILDTNGRRFYLGMKLFQLNLTKGVQFKSISMRDVTFALHSDNKDLLFNIINENSGGQIGAPEFSRNALAYWIEHTKLAEVMETVARTEFLKTQDTGRYKDPSVCSLHFLALHKRNVLVGLWRTSYGHPEQQKMIRFLGNDFKQDRWRSAAMKNAFVLLGKHRYIDAAYFFLLADSLKDCVNVVISKLHDTALAVAIARCYEKGDHGPVMKNIVLKHILPTALRSYDRWSASWCFWILGDRGLSIQALIKPTKSILEDSRKFGDVDSKLADELPVRKLDYEDPVLLVMYNSLRNRRVEYLRGTLDLDSQTEFEFVLAAALMYGKMGCDYLSLYLVSNWEFSEKKEIVEPTTGKEVQPPPPSQFQEPDMSAFDFGF